MDRLNGAVKIGCFHVQPYGADQLSSSLYRSGLTAFVLGRHFASRAGVCSGSEVGAAIFFKGAFRGRGSSSRGSGGSLSYSDAFFR